MARVSRFDDKIENVRMARTSKFDRKLEECEDTEEHEDGGDVSRRIRA